MKAYQFLVQLEQVNHDVWRRFIIPAETNFKRLHETIQMTMGWSNYHLFSFIIPLPNGKQLELVTDNETIANHQTQVASLLSRVQERDNLNLNYVEERANTEMKLAQSTKLTKFVESQPIFTYHYDFGDDWKHRVTLERVIDDYEVSYPQLLDGGGNCPPEDVGGPKGYDNFLDVLSNPFDEEYERLKSWANSQGYRHLDQKQTNEFMKTILKLKRI